MNVNAGVDEPTTMNAETRLDAIREEALQSGVVAAAGVGGGGGGGGEENNANKT
jgi:hypothetical protein